jgi:hypothetical protein
MIAPLTAARSILQSAHGLLNEEAAHPHLAPMLTQAAERLADQAILILQGMRAARPATTLGGLDDPSAAAGAVLHQPRLPTLATPIDAQREQRATPIEGGSDAAGSGQGGEPAPYRPAYTVPAPERSTEPAVWTAQRCAHMTEAVPRGDGWDDILLALNAMPGAATVASSGAAKVQAAKMGLRRPEGWAEARAAENGRKGAAARAAAGIPMPNHCSPHWNDARDAVVREHWPAGTDSAEIMRLINAIPHEKPVTDLARLAERASKLGVSRSAEHHAAVLAKRTAAMMAAKPTVWTEERLALLDAEYASAWDLGDLLVKVAALPGPPPASVDSMAKIARARGLSRRPPAPEADAAREAAPPAPAPAAAGADWDAEVAPVDPEISHTRLLERQEKARGLLRRGVAPAIVKMQCAPIELREVFRLAGEVRDEKRAAASTMQDVADALVPALKVDGTAEAAGAGEGGD